MTTSTAPLDRARIAPAPTMQDREDESPAIPVGIAAALVTSGWTLFFDRRVESHILWASVAAALAVLALAWPIVRRGVLRRAGLAAVQIAAVLLVVFSADRAMATWEERAPRFGVASTLASGALNLLGFRAASERGLLMIDHPDGVVTILPSMEKLAVRPLLLFWVGWVALRLFRRDRRLVASAGIGLLATLLVGLARYVVLLAIYAEHDDILAGNSGLAALDRFASPWIASGCLVLAGLAADRAVRWLVGRDVSATATARPKIRAVLKAGAAVGGLSMLAGLAGSFVPTGVEKAGRILIDDRYCGIWEPTARQLDTQWYGDFPTYSFTSLAEWLGKWYAVDANTSRPYDDELLSGYDVLILKTPEEPFPDAEIDAIDRFVRRGGGLLLVGDHTNLLGMGTHLNALSARHGIQFRYDSVSDGLTGGFVDYLGPCSRPTNAGASRTIMPARASSAVAERIPRWSTVGLSWPRPFAWDEAGSPRSPIARSGRRSPCSAMTARSWRWTSSGS